MVNSKGNLRFILKGKKWDFVSYFGEIDLHILPGSCAPNRKGACANLSLYLFVCLFVSDVIIVFLCFLYINV